ALCRRVRWQHRTTPRHSETATTTCFFEPDSLLALAQRASSWRIALLRRIPPSKFSRGKFSLASARGNRAAQVPLAMFRYREWLGIVRQWECCRLHGSERDRG